MIGIGRLGIRGVDSLLCLVEIVMTKWGQRKRVADGQWVFVSGTFPLPFRICVSGWLQQGIRVDAGRLQQGCRQILGGIWDETRFQIIFSIRPHEMYLGFSLHIITTLFSTNTHATASFRKDER
jgi:hypothetical protein